MDYSPPGFSVHGISQARILEWVAISYSRGSSKPRDWTHISCSSCPGRQILYQWASCEGPLLSLSIRSFPAGRSVTVMAFLKVNLTTCVSCITNVIIVHSSHSPFGVQPKVNSLVCKNVHIRMFITTWFLTAKSIRNIQMSINGPALQCNPREHLKNYTFIFYMRNYQCKWKNWMKYVFAL